VTRVLEQRFQEEIALEEAAGYLVIHKEPRRWEPSSQLYHIAMHWDDIYSKCIHPTELPADSQDHQHLRYLCVVIHLEILMQNFDIWMVPWRRL
jgi:hypothetical protein